MKRYFSLLFVLVCTVVAMAKSGTTYIVEANSLNVRQKPNTDALVIGKVTKGQEILVLSIERGWACISYKNGNGYVSAQYITKKSSTGTKSAETSSAKSSASSAAKSSATTKSSASTTAKSASAASGKRSFPYTEGDRARYGGWTEVGTIFNNRGGGFNLDLVNGCYIRDYIFVGAGVGVRGYFSFAGALVSIPFYAQARGVLRVNRVVAPFLDFGIGGYAGFASDWENHDTGGGFYMRIAPGIRLGKHFHTSIGYERCGVNTGVITVGADW